MSFWLFWVSLVLSDGIEAYFRFGIWVLGSQEFGGSTTNMWIETAGKERDERSWKWTLALSSIARSKCRSNLCKGIWLETFEARRLNWGEVGSRRRNWQQERRIEEISDRSFASRKTRHNAELVFDEMVIVYGDCLLYGAFSKATWIV